MLELIRDGEAGLERAADTLESGSPVVGRTAGRASSAREGPLCGHQLPEPRCRAGSVPQEPYFFAKLPNATIGPGDPILVPMPETFADWEVEFALVIGEPAHRVAAADVMEHVFGYTLLSDVSARDVQLEWTERTQSTQITLGKNPDTFAPIGPELVTADELPDPGNVRPATYVNGEQKQDGTTADWLFRSRSSSSS